MKRQQYYDGWIGVFESFNFNQEGFEEQARKLIELMSKGETGWTTPPADAFDITWSGSPMTINIDVNVSTSLILPDGYVVHFPQSSGHSIEAGEASGTAVSAWVYPDYDFDHSVFSSLRNTVTAGEVWSLGIDANWDAYSVCAYGSGTSAWDTQGWPYLVNRLASDPDNPTSGESLLSAFMLISASTPATISANYVNEYYSITGRKAVPFEIVFAIDTTGAVSATTGFITLQDASATPSGSVSGDGRIDQYFAENVVNKETTEKITELQNYDNIGLPAAIPFQGVMFSNTDTNDFLESSGGLTRRGTWLPSGTSSVSSQTPPAGLTHYSYTSGDKVLMHTISQSAGSAYGALVTQVQTLTADGPTGGTVSRFYTFAGNYYEAVNEYGATSASSSFWTQEPSDETASMWLDMSGFTVQPPASLSGALTATSGLSGNPTFSIDWNTEWSGPVVVGLEKVGYHLSGVTYWGGHSAIPPAPVTYTTTFAENCATSAAWTEDDLNNISAVAISADVGGVGIRGWITYMIKPYVDYGVSAGATDPSGSVYSFDPSDDSWTELARWTFPYSNDEEFFTGYYQDNYYGIVYNDQMVIWSTTAGTGAGSAHEYTLTGHSGGYVAYVYHPVSGLHIFGGQDYNANSGVNITYHLTSAIATGVSSSPSAAATWIDLSSEATGTSTEKLGGSGSSGTNLGSYGQINWPTTSGIANFTGVEFDVVGITGTPTGIVSAYLTSSTSTENFIAAEPVPRYAMRLNGDTTTFWGAISAVMTTSGTTATPPSVLTNGQDQLSAIAFPSAGVGEDFVRMESSNGASGYAGWHKAQGCVSFWVREIDAGSLDLNGHFCGKYVSSPTWAAYAYVAVHETSAVRFNIGSHTPEVVGEARSGAITGGDWHHIAVNWDQNVSGGYIDIWHNGVRTDYASGIAGAWTATYPILANTAPWRTWAGVGATNHTRYDDWFFLSGAEMYDYRMYDDTVASAYIWDMYQEGTYLSSLPPAGPTLPVYASGTVTAGNLSAGTNRITLSTVYEITGSGAQEVGIQLALPQQNADNYANMRTHASAGWPRYSKPISAIAPTADAYTWTLDDADTSLFRILSGASAEYASAYTTPGVWPTGGGFSGVGVLEGTPQCIVGTMVTGGVGSGIYLMPWLPSGDIASATVGTSSTITTQADFENNISSANINTTGFPGNLVLAPDTGLTVIVPHNPDSDGSYSVGMSWTSAPAATRYQDLTDDTAGTRVNTAQISIQTYWWQGLPTDKADDLADYTVIKELKLSHKGYCFVGGYSTRCWLNIKYDGSMTRTWDSYYTNTNAWRYHSLTQTPDSTPWTKDNLALATDLEFVIEREQRGIYQEELQADVHFYYFETSGTSVYDINPGVGTGKTLRVSDYSPGGASITYNISAGDTSGSSSGATYAGVTHGQTIGDWEWYRVEIILSGSISGGYSVETPVVYSLAITTNEPAARLTNGLRQFIKYDNGTSYKAPMPMTITDDTNPNSKINLPIGANITNYDHMAVVPYGHSSGGRVEGIQIYDTLNDTWFNYGTSIYSTEDIPDGHITAPTFTSGNTIYVISDGTKEMDEGVITIEVSEPLVVFVKEK